MPSLTDLTEQLASSALIADPADLSALARLHEQLQAVPTHVAGQSDISGAVASRFSGVATQASKLIEQIILRELNDTNSAFEQVCKQITELQQILSGGIESGSPPAAPATAAAPSVHAPSVAAAASTEIE